MVMEIIQKDRERAKVAHSTIMSVIILMYSFINTSLSEFMLTDVPCCGTGDGSRNVSGTSECQITNTLVVVFLHRSCRPEGVWF